ncbi:hypothetical protein CTEN210_01205 [Chaetoceros tenuissimus]|uniref:Methyltransferase FkbM domain-containing protein n=1 Tax=Chaetoceros tenuissimus TaxID=426638 RepID=A0AAD3GZH8_9STRA|nr:hypothetical protein CTEN210_01205 [Chaetoceros tenuissimus]
MLKVIFLSCFGLGVLLLWIHIEFLEQEINTSKLINHEFLLEQTSLTPPDPEVTDCRDLLEKFKAKEIDIMNNHTERNLLYQSYSRLTNTAKPFYVSTHHREIDHVRSDVMKYGYYYEKQLTKRVIEIFEEKAKRNEKSIFLDVGGNIGWFSLVAAQHGASQVYTFEPNLMNTVRFCESLSLNNWLRDEPAENFIFPISKGAGDTNVALHLRNTGDPRNPGSFSFYVDPKREESFSEEISQVPIEVTTLDSFAERHGWFKSRPSIGLFKLDVELFELKVMQGARKLLGSGLVEKIAMEFKKDHEKAAKEGILQILFEANYELYKHGGLMGPHKNVTKTYSHWKELFDDVEKDMYGENVMFRKKSEV